jgi:hypothetical protein
VTKEGAEPEKGEGKERGRRKGRQALRQRVAQKGTHRERRLHGGRGMEKAECVREGALQRVEVCARGEGERVRAECWRKDARRVLA